MHKWILTVAAVLALIVTVRFALLDGQLRHNAAETSTADAVLTRTSVNELAALEETDRGHGRGARAALDGAPPEAGDSGDHAAVPGDTAHGALVVDVQRADGSPVPDMPLFVASKRDDTAHRIERLHTDAAGRARVAALAPGEYSVSSTRGPGGSATVRAAEETSLVLKFKGGVDVRGLVVAPDGRTIPGAEVWLLTLRRDWRGKERIAITDADGAFQARDVPQRYSLAAYARGFGPSEPLDLELLELPPAGSGEEVTVLRLELTADGGDLVGVVTDPNGAPVGGALVAAGAPGPERDGMRSDSTMAEHWGEHLTETDVDGRYALHGLPVGEMPVMVEARDFPAADGAVAIVSGATLTHDVALVPAATVTGVVRTADGAPVAGAIVIQLPAPFVDPIPSQGPPDRGAPFERPRTRSGADGRFELARVAPGAVHLYAAKGTSY
jgi:hypothetical protein